MGTSCTQLHMFYVADKKVESQRQVLIIAFTHLFVILFFNLLQTTQYLAIYCNMQYIDILYWPYCIVLQ